MNEFVTNHECEERRHVIVGDYEGKICYSETRTNASIEKVSGWVKWILITMIGFMLELNIGLILYLVSH